MHFEQGWPAVRIANMMNVDRNTINADLKLLYDKAIGEYGSEMNMSTYLVKSLYRLETQRDRLCTYLTDTTDISTKVSIKRLISDIDFRLVNTLHKTTTDHFRFWDAVIERVNDLAEKEGWTDRFTSVTKLYKISPDSRQSLIKVREEARLD